MEDSLKSYLLEFQWWIAGLILVAIFKDVIHQLGAGLVWKLGRRYNETDVVIVDEFFCRISRIGFFNVEFYVYNSVENPPKIGWTWTVSNDRLSNLKIWKPLSKHEPMNFSIQKVTSITEKKDGAN